MKFHITSSIAFLIYALLMIGAFIFSTFYQQAPFLSFATWFTGGFGAYIAKRTIQKKEAYREKNNLDEYIGGTD